MLAGGRNIVFLDIDGVLQPFSNTRRYDVDARITAQNYALAVNAPIYGELEPLDVCGALLDWDAGAVACFKSIVDRAGADIVVSSDWRNFNEDAALSALLAIHGLDAYLIGSVAPFTSKLEAIADYLSEHSRDIAGYVVLDDDPRLGLLPNTVTVNQVLSEEDVDEALAILQAQSAVRE